MANEMADAAASAATGHRGNYFAHLAHGDDVNNKWAKVCRGFAAVKAYMWEHYPAPGPAEVDITNAIHSQGHNVHDLIGGTLAAVTESTLDDGGHRFV